MYVEGIKVSVISLKGSTSRLCTAPSSKKTNFAPEIEEKTAQSFQTSGRNSFLESI